MATGNVTTVGPARQKDEAAGFWVAEPAVVLSSSAKQFESTSIPFLLLVHVKNVAHQFREGMEKVGAVWCFRLFAGLRRCAKPSPRPNLWSLRLMALRPRHGPPTCWWLARERPSKSGIQKGLKEILSVPFTFEEQVFSSRVGRAHGFGVYVSQAACWMGSC